MKSSASTWLVVTIVVVIALAAYAVIATRRARRQQRERSQERSAAMLLALHQEAARGKAQANGASARPGAPVPQAQGSTAAPAPAAPVPQPPRPPAAPEPAPLPAVLARKPRLLTDTQRLLFLVLRTGLPDHVILANQRIVDLIDVPPDHPALERDPRLRDLARHQADFVVCTGTLEPVAAIVVYEAGSAPSPSEQTKIETLREIGVRFLRFRADSLPRPNEIRGFVLG